MFDWFLAQGASGSAISVVYDNDVDLILLGDQARVLKPNQTQHVYVRHFFFIYKHYAIVRLSALNFVYIEFDCV